MTGSPEHDNTTPAECGERRWGDVGWRHEPHRHDPVRPEEIKTQREKGWTDFHPEAFCHRCGLPNVWSWSATAEDWTAAGLDEGDIVCPQCFSEAHETTTGTRTTWYLRRAALASTATPGDERPTHMPEGIEPSEWARSWFEEIVQYGDDRGTIANLVGDELREVVRLATDEVRAGRATADTDPPRRLAGPVVTGNMLEAAEEAALWTLYGEDGRAAPDGRFAVSDAEKATALRVIDRVLGAVLAAAPPVVPVGPTDDCPLCGGVGSGLVDGVEEECRQCDGRGWVPLVRRASGDHPAEPERPPAGQRWQHDEPEDHEPRSDPAAVGASRCLDCGHLIHLVPALNECIAEGHWTTVFDGESGWAETVHDPDEGPCEFAAGAAGVQPSPPEPTNTGLRRRRGRPPRAAAPAPGEGNETGELSP